MNIRFVYVFLVLIISGFTVNSQIKVGQWRNQISYNNVNTLDAIGSSIYCGSKISMFSFDINDGSYEKISKIDGLSEAIIKTVKYHKSSESMIIAYENSNIDIIKDNVIYNIADIKRKQISGDKRINNIIFRGDSAYLSCGFGIVVFDIVKREFKDSYFIGDEASFINVYDITFDSRYIYAATQNGIYKADKFLPTLSDYRNWSKIKEIPDYNKSFNTICFSNGVLYTNCIDQDSGENKNYKFSDNAWSIFNPEMKSLQSIVSKNGKTIFADRSLVHVYDEFGRLETQISWYNFADTSSWMTANYATLDDQNNLLIADSRFGLVILYSNGVVEHHFPDGPANSYVGKILNQGNDIYVTGGTKGTTAWHAGQYYTFSNESWSSMVLPNFDILDFYDICTDPTDRKKLYIGSWGFGLFEYENNIQTVAYDQYNSTLSESNGQVNISAVKFDNYKNLWVANSGAVNPISVKTLDNTWYSYNFYGEISGASTDDLIITSFGNIWLELEEGGGLFAFDDKGTPEDDSDDDYKKFVPIDSNGEIVSNNVYAIAEDKDGHIWVGTDAGPVVYYNPENVFTGEYFFADRIQLTAFGNDTTEQYLLETETVTCIKVDGANRKWIGTQNSGVFLVSDDGREEIHSFNTSNSPLFSNTIIDIEINSQTGEVFIGTDKGIISYRSDATEPSTQYSDVYVFPNPVRPDYTGAITITGLVNESNVRITDIAGNLVYESDSLGGQVIWDGYNFEGRRVNTGVYLIYCTDKLGERTTVSKLLFMN